MSLFKVPSPKPRLARNGFDLSSRRVFSAKAGQLLPVGCWEVNPSEHFRFQVQDLVRTTTVNTAAFARMKEYYHFFFVSYKSLWQWFDQFIVGTPNPVSALNGIGVLNNSKPDYSFVPSSVPSFDVDSVINAASKISKDSQGFSYFDGAMKLLNILGYGVSSNGGRYPYSSLSGGYADVPSPESDLIAPFKPVKPKASPLVSSASPFRLLAYQKIFNDFYRVQDWSTADVRSFNIDDYASDSNLKILGDVAAKFCQMRYRPYSKDWITSMKPTPSYDKGIFNLPDYVGHGNGGVSRASNGVSGASTFINGVSVLSVNDLRAAFALDKMLEATRRANGFDYSSQIEAHFGFRVPESRAGDARFIGGFDNPVVISEVVNQASLSNVSGSDAVLGDLGGKGVGSLNSSSIDFDAKEHGLIMCIYSVVPQTEYNGTYFDPFNRKLRREDFFQPEFADLGYQPVVTSDLISTYLDNPVPDGPEKQKRLAAGYPLSSIEANNRLLGWQVRYNEYKTSRDLVFGDFESGLSLSYWCSPRYDFGFDGKAGDKKLVNSPWSPAHFYVNPSILNTIFLVSAVKADHFLVNSFFDVKAVRPMSVSGLAGL